METEDLPGAGEQLTEAEPQTNSLVLSDADRRKFLGRMVEFEMLLSRLTDKQANFVLARLEKPDGTAEWAARTAGYKQPAWNGHMLLKNQTVQAAIALGNNLREDRTMITSDRTLHELAIIAFSDIGHYEIDLTGHRLNVADGVPEYARRAVASFDVEEKTYEDNEGRLHTTRKAKVRLWNKTDALRMLAVYQKLLSDVGTPGNVTIDKSKHVHLHQHQHNTWEIGGDKVTF